MGKHVFALVMVMTAAPACSDAGQVDDSAETVGTTAAADSVSTSGGFKTFGGLHGKCLDVQFDNLSAGTPIDSANCNDTTAQEWTRVGSTLRPTANQNLCIDIQFNDPTRGVVALQPCNGTAAQNWTFSGGRIVATNHNTFCLDVLGGNFNTNGQRVDITTCNGTEAQDFWPFGFSVQFKETESGLCLDVFGDSTAPGTELDDFTCGNTNDAQIFTLTEAGQITNHGLCATIETFTGDTGGLLMDTCVPGSAFQTFHFQLRGPVGTGGWVQVISQELTPDLGPNCLDLFANNTSPSVRVDTFSCNNGSNGSQSWQPSFI